MFASEIPNKFREDLMVFVLWSTMSIPRLKYPTCLQWVMFVLGYGLLIRVYLARLVESLDISIWLLTLDPQRSPWVSWVAGQWSSHIGEHKEITDPKFIALNSWNTHHHIKFYAQLIQPVAFILVKIRNIWAIYEQTRSRGTKLLL